MKALIIVAVVLGFGALFGTRRTTPFLRWGIILAVGGVAVMSAALFFAVRSATFGGVLILAGAAAYYFGRIVRKEQLFVKDRTR